MAKINMRKIPEHIINPESISFTIGDIITCPKDGSNGAEWRIENFDRHGNILAKLIKRADASRFYPENMTIAPQAWDKWQKIE